MLQAALQRFGMPDAEDIAYPVLMVVLVGYGVK
jgi:hypothetical protein